MGAVYQAWDEELGVSVALKVIRPEITADPAAARDIERRFKRELLLARQVTHKNVVRIHDLGELNGIKYLTMPYIQGSDLASVLRQEGTLSVVRTLAIARQVAGGLEAAHAAGVVHRDLKPANIMIDADEQAVIMDFGISRSVSGAGATMAGAVVGTLEYMAPEQAMAQPVDHRSDIYAFGLMVRDMLVGPRNAGGAETAVAELMARMHMALPPARAVDASIPVGLDALITRCTEPNASARYQTTRELVADLESLDQNPHRTKGLTAPLLRPGVGGPAATGSAARSAPRGAARAAIAAGLLVAVLGGGWLLRGQFTGETATSSGPAADKPLSLAIVPLRNSTGNPTLDWLGPSLADMLAADIGQSPRLHLVSQDRVFQLLRDLRIGSATELDAGTLRRLSEFTSADTVASGRFEQLGEQIRINVTLHSGSREPIVVRASAAGENDLLRAAQELAAGIRQNLALSADAVRDLEARAFRPSTTSVPALRHYGEGVQLAREGEHLAATARFEDATLADPQFALAFSKLALSFDAIGRGPEAEEASRQAVSLSGQLPADERELIVGTHARVVDDVDDAITSLERLVEARPSDMQLQFELAELYERNGAFEKAAAAYGRVVQVDPKHGEALYAAGRVAIRRGDHQGSLESLNSALTIAIQLDKPEARARVLQALGIGYRNLGRHDDALTHFEQSLTIKKQIGDERGIASSLSEIAYIHDLQGRPEKAVDNYREALQIRRALGDKRGVGITLANLGASYLDRGRYTESLEVLKEAVQIHRETGDAGWEALCLTNIGNLYYAMAQYEEARTYLERALGLREKSKVASTIAVTLASLADVATRVGDYERAQQQYLRAIELWRADADRRGAAIGAFGMGTLLEQQARYGAAADAKREALETFRELKEQSFWFAEILGGYGATLTMLGRSDEARQPLAEALALARDLRHDALISQMLNFQGDAAYFAGDLKSARAHFQQAREAAERSANRYQVLRSRLNLGKVAAHEGRAAAVADLRSISREADSLGLRPLALECRQYLGLALLESGKAREARAEFQMALVGAERLGARTLMARIHRGLAKTFGIEGEAAQAARHASQATDIIETIRQESRVDAIAARYDLAPLDR